MIETKPEDCSLKQAAKPGIMATSTQDRLDREYKVDICFVDPRDGGVDLTPQLLISERPMEHVFFKCSKLPVSALDTSGAIKFTDIFLHLYKDAFTNMILPHYLGFQQFDAVSFVNSLHRVYFLNDKLLSEFHNGRSPWYQPRSIENIFFNDSIKAFSGKQFESLLQSGIRLKHLLQLNDFDLNLVNKQISRKLKKLTKSHKFSPARSDHTYLANRQNKAVLSIDMLNEVICMIIDDYNHSYQAIQQGSPAQRFRSALESEQMTAAPCCQHFKKVFSIVENKPLEQGGIEFKGIFYSSPELELEYQHHPGRLMTIEIEPWDLSQIRVHCDNGIIKVPARKSFYTEGLSLDRHEATLKMFRKKWAYEDIHGFVRIDQPLKKVLHDIEHSRKISTNGQ